MSTLLSNKNLSDSTNDDDDDDNNGRVDDSAAGSPAKTPKISNDDHVRSLKTTPHKEYMDAFRAFMKANGYVGVILIQGIANHIHDGFYHEFKPRYSKTKSWPKKFDLLFAYTYKIKEYDCWMRDNEGDMEGMVSELACLWKKPLQKSNEELGVDAEYTRPGVLALLEDFKTMLDECEDCGLDYRFKYNY